MARSEWVRDMESNRSGQMRDSMLALNFELLREITGRNGWTRISLCAMLFWAGEGATMADDPETVLNGPFSFASGNADGVIEVSLKPGFDSTSASLKALSECHNLQLFTAKRVRLGRRGFAAVLQHPKVTFLSLDSTDISDNDLQLIGKMPKINYASFCATGITNQGITCLEGAQTIETLMVAGCRELTQDCLVSIARLRNLKELNISGMRLSGDLAGDCIASMSSLEALEMYGSEVSVKVLSCLPRLRKLKRVSLSCSNLNDLGAAHIGEVTSLEWLAVEQTKITTIGASYIMSLPNLHTLEIRECGDLSASIRTLPQHGRLKCLYYDGPLDHRAVEVLCGLPSIRELYVQGVTEEQRRQIMRTRPDVEVY